MILVKELFYACLSVLVFIGENATAYQNRCSGRYCFIVSENKNEEFMTPQDAQQWCLSNGSQLVEIINKDIQSSLLSIVRTYGLDDGTYITNGKRSTGNWIRLSGANIGNISIHEQPDISYAYGYLRFSTSVFDTYASRPTDLKGGYICSGVSDCTNGIRINGQCHKVYLEQLSWYGARNKCLDAGGDLASFYFINTNVGFSTMDRSWIYYRQNNYWIGIRREWWTWQSSNTDVKYSFWSTGQPQSQTGQPQSQDDCLCLSKSQLQWFGCLCNQRYRFVCISGTTSFTNDADHSSEDQPWISVGIGVGVGCLLIISVVVVVIIILKRKRDPPKKDQRNIHTPDLVRNQGTGAIPPHNEATVYATVAETSERNENRSKGLESQPHNEGMVYATVLKPSESDEHNSSSKGFESNDKSQLVYVDLQILNSASP